MAAAIQDSYYRKLVLMLHHLLTVQESSACDTATMLLQVYSHLNRYRLLMDICSHTAHLSARHTCQSHGCRRQ